jgi:hypothetical protein
MAGILIQETRQGKRALYFPLLAAKLYFRLNQEDVNGCLLS